MTLQKGRKHCGKRRNCSLRAISPFPTVFSEDLNNRYVKTKSCLGKGYALPSNQTLYMSKLKTSPDHKTNVAQILGFVVGRVENMVENGDKVGYQYSLTFTLCFGKCFFPQGK